MNVNRVRSLHAPRQPRPRGRDRVHGLQGVHGPRRCGLRADLRLLRVSSSGTSTPRRSRAPRDPTRVSIKSARARRPDRREAEAAHRRDPSRRRPTSRVTTPIEDLLRIVTISRSIRTGRSHASRSPRKAPRRRSSRRAAELRRGRGPSRSRTTPSSSRSYSDHVALQERRPGAGAQDPDRQTAGHRPLPGRPALRPAHGE